jgi:hypothetical protein
MIDLPDRSISLYVSLLGKNCKLNYTSVMKLECPMTLYDVHSNVITLQPLAQKKNMKPSSDLLETGGGQYKESVRLKLAS